VDAGGWRIRRPLAGGELHRRQQLVQKEPALAFVIPPSFPGNFWALVRAWRIDVFDAESGKNAMGAFRLRSLQARGSRNLNYPRVENPSVGQSRHRKNKSMQSSTAPHKEKYDET
jgi:hypothetical protein